MPDPVIEKLSGRFLRLWGATTSSAIGSGLLTVAAPLLVATYTRNPLVVSSAFAVAWLPWLLFALPGGVLVDRVDRRRLMVALDSLRVVALAGLAAAVLTGAAGVAVLYGVLFVANTCEVVLRSASQAMVPAVVPSALLERANGWLVAGSTVAQQLVAGPVAGALFAVAAGLPFAAGAAGYLGSAALLLAVAGRFGPESAPLPVTPAARRTVRADVGEAFRWLLGQRLLRTMSLLIGLLNLTLTAATAVLVLLARERLGLGSVGYGLLFGCMAAGGLLGSVVGDRIIRWASPTWTVRIGLLVEAALHLTLATSHSVLLIGVVFAVFGVHGSLWSIVAVTLRQRLTPPAMLGRVASTNLFLAAGGNCIGALLGGAVASSFGITAPYWAGFALAVVVSAATWRTFDRSVVGPAYSPATAPATRTDAGTADCTA